MALSTLPIDIVSTVQVHFHFHLPKGAVNRVQVAFFTLPICAVSRVQGALFTRPIGGVTGFKLAFISISSEEP